MYSDSELLWIELSIYTSFMSLPYVNFMVEKCGLEETVNIIRRFESVKDIPCEVIEQFPYKDRSSSSWEKKIGYCNSVSQVKNKNSVLDNAEKIGCTIVTPESKFWNSRLDCLELGKPLALWCRGKNMELLLSPNSVSMVGSRKCDVYGKNTAIDLANDLSNKGVVIVSGGALGIDSYSHIGALNGKVGTVSVLAGGVDRLYPSSNSSLFASILEKGLVVSESPIGTRPAKWKFLERNRIIAGLCDLTVIVQAPLRSGALNTANYCLEYGRTLCAVPGNIDSPFSKGANSLLKQGAYPVTCSNDVLELLSLDTEQLSLFEESESDLVEDRILSSLYKTKGRSVQDLFLECELELKLLMKTLSFLEIKGKCYLKDNLWFLQ